MIERPYIPSPPQPAQERSFYTTQRVVTEPARVIAQQRVSGIPEQQNAGSPLYGELATSQQALKVDWA